MELDLRKLYGDTKVPVNQELIIPEEYYKNLDVIKISPVKVIAEVSLNYDNELELVCHLEGIFTMPCAISLQEVEEPFNIDLEIIIEQKNRKNQISLDLLDILWENIVLEVPMRIIKEGIKTDNIKGEGWELEGL